MIQGARIFLLDLVFPPRCVGCQRSGQWFCNYCAQTVQPTHPQQTCRSCDSPLSTDVAVQGAPCLNCRNPLGLIRAAALHVPPLEGAIHALKYEGRAELAPSLARYLRAATMADPWPAIIAGLDGIVPVPLHEGRLIERGYNQAELLADSFAKEISTPILEGAIARVRETPSQVGLLARDRAENVKNAFRVEHGQVRGNSLLLVDDVCTTGSTMRECALALRGGGAVRVFGLALSEPASSAREQFNAEHSPPF